MIPKKIHYCWFGRNPLPELFIECKKKIEELCPGYEIKEWNEDTFDVNSVRFVKEAYEAKKFAFVADYVRMYALYTEGGVYIETDAMLKKGIDELLNTRAFVGLGDETVTLVIFGCEKGHPVPAEMLNYYNEQSFIKKDGSYNMTTINIVMNDILVKQYGMTREQEIQYLADGITIYPTKYFYTDWSSGRMKVSPESYAIHYSAASWQDEKTRVRKKCIARCSAIFGTKVGTNIGRTIASIKIDGWGYAMRKMKLEMLEKLNPFFVSHCPFRIKKKIIFDNFNGMGYGCNPKYIAEELLKRGKKYKLLWVVKDKNVDLPDRIEKVKTGTCRYYYEMATSKIWIDNVRKGSEIRKREGQYYIQTWHGFIPFKKMEKDVEDNRGEKANAKSINDSKMADLFLSGCKKRTELYTNGAFWYSGAVLEVGTPRNDVLLERDKPYEKVYGQLGIELDKKIVLYAPTFRNSKSLKVLNLETNSLVKGLEEKFGGEYVCLVRLHPSMRHLSKEFIMGTEAIDVSEYNDVQELFAVADVVVSDYSDCMFESSLAGCKVFVYASDIADYMDERDFYFQLNELPYLIAENNVQMQQNIKAFDLKKYEKNVNEFFKKQGVYESGRACEAVVDWIIEKIES